MKLYHGSNQAVEKPQIIAGVATEYLICDIDDYLENRRKS